VVLEDDQWPEPVDAADARPASRDRGLGEVPPGYRLGNADESVDLRDNGWPESGA
jgi:hypothetical protein